MRIGIYDPYLDDIGGGEKYMMTLALCLAKENQVDIFWDRKEDLDKLGERFSLAVENVHVVPNLFTKSTSTLKRFIATIPYDVIIVLSDGSIPLVGARKLLIHIQQPLRILQRSSLIDKIKLSRVSTCFCNSKYTKSFIDQKFSLKTQILYPPILLPEEKVLGSVQQAKNKKENIILTVGRFRVKNVSNGDYKKQGVLLKVFKEMVDKGLKGWEFVIATSIREEDEKEFAKMQRDAKGYPIRFLVNTPNNKLWDIYLKAKIYWHASGFGEDLQKHPEFAEHFGISTVEAMGGADVPVVINAGGQKEIVTEGINGFLWDSLEELQQKTLNLIHDEKLLHKLSNQAKISSQKLGGDRFCREVHELILG